MGPLKGVRILEFAGIGPGPFCGMLLADLGADVIRIDRKSGGGLSAATAGSKADITGRGKRSIAVDLKTAEGVEACLHLIARADALIEGFRPGVMERLGLGPDTALEHNAKLVYGRMTGWGQTGPLANAAGHDINYIALTGALHAIGGPGGKPTPPLNLVGDFGGGALYLALGVAAALFEAARSGKGQVVDAAMTDGASSLMTVFHMFQALGQWSDKRGANLLDGGAHFYDTYETADGKYVAVGAIEPQFYALLRDKLGLADSAYDAQMNPQGWPDLKQKLAAVFATKTRDAWCEILEGTDACFAPVLTMAEAAGHPHNRARETLIERDGVRQPNAAPRFSRTACEIGPPSPAVGADNDTVFEDWGVDPGAIASLKDRGAI